MSTSTILLVSGHDASGANLCRMLGSGRDVSGEPNGPQSFGMWSYPLLPTLAVTTEESKRGMWPVHAPGTMPVPRFGVGTVLAVHNFEARKTGNSFSLLLTATEAKPSGLLAPPGPPEPDYQVIAAARTPEEAVEAAASFVASDKASRAGWSPPGMIAKRSGWSPFESPADEAWLADMAASAEAAGQPNEALVLAWKDEQGEVTASVIAERGPFLFVETKEQGRDVGDLGLPPPPGPGLWLMTGKDIWTSTDWETGHVDDYGLDGTYASTDVETASKHFGKPARALTDTMLEAYPYILDLPLLEAVHLKSGDPATVEAPGMSPG